MNCVMHYGKLLRLYYREVVRDGKDIYNTKDSRYSYWSNRKCPTGIGRYS